MIVRPRDSPTGPPVCDTYLRCPKSPASCLAWVCFSTIGRSRTFGRSSRPVWINSALTAVCSDQTSRSTACIPIMPRLRKHTARLSHKICTARYSMTRHRRSMRCDRRSTTKGEPACKTLAPTQKPVSHHDQTLKTLHIKFHHLQVLTPRSA